MAVEAKGRPASKAAAAVPKLPARVRLTAPHGFIGADGTRHHWVAGQVVDDAATIRLLTERQAHIEALP